MMTLGGIFRDLPGENATQNLFKLNFAKFEAGVESNKDDFIRGGFCFAAALSANVGEVTIGENTEEKGSFVASTKACGALAIGPF